LKREPKLRAGRSPAKPAFSMGFLTGHELTWMPEALRILRDHFQRDVMISSHTPAPANAFRRENRRRFLRREKECRAWRSSSVKIFDCGVPSDHRCCLKAISPGSGGETFVGVAHTAPVVRAWSTIT